MLAWRAVALAALTQFSSASWARPKPSPAPKASSPAPAEGVKLPAKERKFLDGVGCGNRSDAERVQCGRENVFRACSEFQSMLMLKGCSEKDLASSKRCVSATRMDASVAAAVNAYQPAHADYQKLESAGFATCARKSVQPKRPSPCPLQRAPPLADVRAEIKRLRGLVDRSRCEFETVHKASIAAAIADARQLLDDADRYAAQARGQAAAAKEQSCKAYARLDFALRLCIATGEGEVAAVDARCKQRYDKLVAAIRDEAESLRRLAGAVADNARSLGSCGGLTPRPVDVDGCLARLPKSPKDYCSKDLARPATECLGGVQQRLDKDTQAVGAALARPCAASFIADKRPSPTVKFRFPVEDRSIIEDSVAPLAGPFHMDHSLKPKEGAFCIDFNGDGLPHCYGGHTGTDFMLKGGFSRMDSGQSWIVPAADGTVARVEDGNYDRCHSPAYDVLQRGWFFGHFVQIDCDGHPLNKPNYIDIDHGGGITTRYFHIKKGSAKVKVGDRVTCGKTHLAQIGSAGKSSAPHLHFEVQYQGTPIDPFQGKLTPRSSFWVDQGRGRLPASKCK